MAAVARPHRARHLPHRHPERDDRLYPGDPQQFRVGGHGLAYGAAGVVYALAATGALIPDPHVEWLLAAVERARPVRVGLMDGLTGVAFALHRAGRPEALPNLLDRILDASAPQGNSLFSGRAGLGLGLLHLAGARGCRPDPVLLERALTLARGIVDDLGRTADAAGSDAAAAGSASVANATNAAAGLLRGWSGPALLLTRLYAATRDPALLDAAERALDRDLARCEVRPGGAVHLSDGVRVQPFLGDGSAGVGLALHALAAYRDTERHAELRTGIAAACRAELVYETGLFHGRAGMLAYRAAIGEPADQLADGARSLLRYAATRDGAVTFPGRLLLRRSTDLATGAAGVLLALHGALSGEPAVLPFPGCGPFVRKAVGDLADRRHHHLRAIPSGGERNVDPRPSGPGVRRGG
ncbi:lanthionine synthetase C family protein [Streptomycetaceae bacterium NBC_01309]